MPATASAVAATTIGALIAFSGIKGATLADTARAVLAGNLALSTTEGIGSGSAAGTGASGQDLATAALGYAGHKYVYGGPSSPADGWDCSSFVSYILGQAGIAIPGGTWAAVTANGQGHGPTADEYLTWSGAVTVPAGQVQPGDLLCWVTHVGFAVDSTHMISALDTAQGTIESGWDGPSGEGQPRVRRVTATGQAAPAGSSSNSASANQALAKSVIRGNPAYSGWDTGQAWTDLVNLWNQESGWSATAKNPSSGAYGIAQALPASKYPAAGQEPTSDPTAQIQWGLEYIAQRYGSPVMAWAHEQSSNWY